MKKQEVCSVKGNHHRNYAKCIVSSFVKLQYAMRYQSRNGIQNMSNIIADEERYGANYYAPLPVVLIRGKGVTVWDEAGKQYLDMMSAYSAVSHGHCHPRLLKTLNAQASELAVVSRAYYSNKLAPFLKRLCELTGYEKIAPMNTGAEAVEVALKSSRKWAYTVKGVAEDKAEILVCEGNFHGRTLGIVSFSTEQAYKANFGPLLPGFKSIPFDDADALESAITENTCAFIVEPIQGEGGVRVPSPGYLKRCAEICKKHNVLLICDEIQTGMGRTGELLACQHDNVKPDGVIMGKALGGGLMPVSAFLSREDVLGVFEHGDHGSTFGGNPLAASVGLEALNVLLDEGLIENSKKLGDYLLEKMRECKLPLIKEVRGKGLFVGIEIDPAVATAREVCLALLKNGVLSKETHETVVRLAPPLIITKNELDDGIAVVIQTLKEIQKG